MYRNAPDVIANDFEDEIVLLNLKTEVYYELKGAAARSYWTKVSPTLSSNRERVSLAASSGCSSTLCSRRSQWLPRTSPHRFA